MKRIFFLLVLVVSFLTTAAQTLKRNDDQKFDADYYLMRSEFVKALDIYLRVLESEPDNADLKHRIGICYLNSDNNKARAIPYLEEACQRISVKYNSNSFKESNAPIEALFMLGSAYRVNNDLDKAIDAYNRYKEYLDPQDDYNNSVTDQYIRNCTLAKEMQQNPVDITTTNLGGVINNELPNFNPVVSGDGKMLAYTTPGRQGFEIYVSAMSDSGWTKPKNITPMLGSGKYLKTCDLSHDGNTLLLVMEDPENSDIYVSRFSRGRWSKAEEFGSAVNSKYNETHASLSADGKIVYFTSNRRGGEGDLDIYKSERDLTGAWGKPVNLGPGVNTPYNEETPFVTDDGKSLYFSSEGHDGIGGYDVYRYDLMAIGSGAVNIGYPLNTTDNNLFYVPFGEGNIAYYALSGTDTYGGRDIYMVVEEVVEDEEVVEVVEVEEVEEVVDVEEVEEGEEVSDVSDVSDVEEVSDVSEVSGVEEVEGVEEFAPRSYSVQFMALRKPVDITFFREMKDITLTYGEDKWYRYIFRTTTDSAEAEALRAELVEQGYRDAFIRRNHYVPQYTVQVMAVAGPVIDLNIFGNLQAIAVTKERDKYCRYTTGEYETRKEALASLDQIKDKGYRRAFVRRIKTR